MVISRNNNTKANITINNEELEQVEEFKYLRQTITADAKTEKEIRTRTRIAKSRFQEIKTILMNRCISQDHTYALHKKKKDFLPLMFLSDQTVKLHHV